MSLQISKPIFHAAKCCWDVVGCTKKWMNVFGFRPTGAAATSGEAAQGGVPCLCVAICASATHGPRPSQTWLRRSKGNAKSNRKRTPKLGYIRYHVIESSQEARQKLAIEAAADKRAEAEEFKKQQTLQQMQQREQEQRHQQEAFTEISRPSTDSEARCRSLSSVEQLQSRGSWKQRSGRERDDFQRR